MKNYTPALVNTGKAKFSFKTLIFGSAGSKNFYYCASHKTEDIYILWIEAVRLGTSLCFPCVLDEQGDAMVYLPHKGAQARADNAAMVARWKLFAQPATFHDEFELRELTAKSFHEEYGKYKNIAMGLTADGEAPAEDDDAPESETPDAASSAETPDAAPEGQSAPATDEAVPATDEAASDDAAPEGAEAAPESDASETET